MCLFITYGMHMDSKTTHKVYIIDGDESVRRAMKRLLRLSGIEVHTFASAGEFLAAERIYENACLIADLKPFEVDGLRLQEKSAEAGCDIPVIFVTAYDDRAAREEARKMGAVAYFLKPVDDHALLDTVEWAFSKVGS